MKATQTNGKIYLLCSWIGKINIVKMLIVPKAIYRFSAILMKISMALFTELKKIILKFVLEHKIS